MLKPNDADSITQIAYFMSRFEHGVKDEDRTLSNVIDGVKKKYFGILDTVARTAQENPKKTSLLIIAAIGALIYISHE